MSTQVTLGKSTPSINLKGGMFTITAIQLFDDNLETLAIQLDEKIKQAPKFFHHAPIIIDVQAIEAKWQGTRTLDFSALCQILKSKKLIPVGIRGGSKILRESAIQAGLAIFPEDKLVNRKRLPTAPLKELLEPVLLAPETPPPIDPPAIPTGGSTRLITQPIRSGQQIYFPGGDLIILAAVGHGAEVLADGNIHIYGPLRGRALAGVRGNSKAMIFCKSLEAELVSIAGQYRISEDLKDTRWKEPACIQLQDGRLNISEL